MGTFASAYAPTSNHTVFTSKVLKELSLWSKQTTNKHRMQPIIVSNDMSLFLNLGKWIGTDLESGA